APAAPKAAAPKAAAPAPAAADVAGTPLTSPMPGMVVSYAKKVGEAVKKGDTVVILEAMKMENALPAPCDGTIKAINFSSGDSVSKGAVLCVIG
uniref:acetyl-CoA carboxylase biotin carboxyl carrier protein subunit n=1 Tax=Desulfococcus sp. TaxID=2025834 RepID=UPI003593E7AF